MGLNSLKGLNLTNVYPNNNNNNNNNKKNKKNKVTRLKITSVLTRVHVSICIQGSKSLYCMPAYGRKKSLQFCRPTAGY
jgi:hypothetical protein